MAAAAQFEQCLLRWRRERRLSWWHDVSLLTYCLCIFTNLATATTATTATTTTWTTSTSTSTSTPTTTTTMATVAKTTLDESLKQKAAATVVSGTNRKRVVLRSVDPLTRRSTVDKHFIRFGRNEFDSDGEGEGEGDSGRYSPHKSINLRKREIFQDNTAATVNVDTRPCHLFDTEDVDDSNRSRLRFASNSCRSSSTAKSNNRTGLDRLRLNYHHHRARQRAFQHQQPSRPPYDVDVSENDDDDDDDDDNFNSDISLRNDENASYLDMDASVAKKVRDESVAKTETAAEDDDSDNNEDADHQDGSDDEFAIGGSDVLRDYQRRRPNNASDGTFFTVRLAPPAAATAVETQLMPGTSTFRADWKTSPDAERFARMSRNQFSRNLFSRYDRGRDNFMRLGRSELATAAAAANDGDGTKEKILPPPSVDNTNVDNDDDDDDDDEDDGGDDTNNNNMINVSWSRTKRNPVHRRFARKHDSFMRLGRKHDSNFMRLGRTQIRSDSPFIRYGRNGNGNGNGNGAGDYDRWTRKHDNFMRLGRNRGQDRHNSLGQNLQTKREKAQNFLRLGRPNEDLMPRRQVRKTAEKLMRFGRRKITAFDHRSGRKFRPLPLIALSRFRRQTQNRIQPDAESSYSGPSLSSFSIRYGDGLLDTMLPLSLPLQWKPKSSSGSGSSSSSMIVAVST